MKKILFVATHRQDRSPSQRFRFEQYLKFLEKEGISYHFSPLLSESDDSYFYSKGKIGAKLLILLKSFLKRMSDILLSSGYEIIFIQREAFVTGTVFFEKTWRLLGKKIIYDFDDSIWLLDVSEANKKFSWMKNPGKTANIISLSTIIFAGNEYLADYARRFNNNVELIPTTIDTDLYKASSRLREGVICIGWSGSITTIKHYDHAVPVLKRVRKKYGDKVKFKVIGDKNYTNNDLSIVGIAWSKENEVEELNTFDIGIMPLPDDEWSKGKCGLKGLQYMSIEIPTIMSPVGVNTEIIQDGVNGFLARTEDEWVEKISRLIESPELRKKLGQAGRKTVLEKYSVNANKEKYLSLFQKMIS